MSAPAPVARPRDATVDWDRVSRDLEDYGCAVLERLLPPAECRTLAQLYPDEARFRSRVVMARHGFGRGEYQYFRYPLPEPIAALRGVAYARLVPIANRWNEAMGLDQRYPAKHAEYLARCHAAGQRKPTPLLLRYENSLKQCSDSASAE